MEKTFIETIIFQKNWNKLELTDDDLRKLQNYIMQNPDAGDIIEGTGRLKKLR